MSRAAVRHGVRLSTGATVVAGLAASLLWASVVVAGEARVTLESLEPPPPISGDEPLIEKFSLERAATYLDRAALDWQKRKDCGTCHTNFAYLLARPAVEPVTPSSGEVRRFFEDLVLRRWKEDEPEPAYVVNAAVMLAMNDRQTTGELSPAARRGLERMIALQRDDGAWDWLLCGWPPMESDDHYGATLAAIGIGAAPGDFASTEAARGALEKIRGYLAKHPAPSLHHRAMVLWASTRVDGLLDATRRAAILEELLAKQLPDGGWSLSSLLAGWKEHRRKDGKEQHTTTSDGYGTGFVLFVAREAGVPAADERLRRGVAWLKSHQRQSGRWFTRSPTRDTRHYISNAGTAFAVMALRSCGEVKSAE